MTFQNAGRFLIGFAASAMLVLAFLLFARSFLVSTIQTPQSEPHYDVLYAGLSLNTLSLAALLFPTIVGVSSFALLKKQIGKKTTLVFSGLAAILLSANLVLLYRMALESMWLGMD